MNDPILAARTRALVQASLKRKGCPIGAILEAERLLVVDVAWQRMVLLDKGQPAAVYATSTALNGLGSEEGSYKTPLGWHRIHGRIGEGQPTGMIFKARIPTGEIWPGEERAEDLITTRILTLEGLEDGVNRGQGVDSLERFIYIHGTNQEDKLGKPLSKGCLRMANADVLDLFDKIQEGDPMVIVDLPARAMGHLHFAGVAGSGMSAIAQFICNEESTQVSGSDRAFDRGQQEQRRKQLEELGIHIFPQDGSAISEACCGVVYSTAVEESVPDFARAKELGLPLIHRSEILAHIVSTMRTIAVTGTSGKSTTVAMVFELLRGAGLDPSLITGGELGSLQALGHWGNAWRGSSDLLVIEADESDGSVVRYKPAIGVVLNLQKDHKEESVVMEMFRAFRKNVKERLIIGECANLEEFRDKAMIFGFGENCALRAEALKLGPESSSFQVEGTAYHLPVPGRHNVENALAALAIGRALDVPLEAMAEPLSRYQGVARRFQITGVKNGITVVDDFGHNPAKVAASLATAHARAGSGRVWAVYQPHAFSQTKFLWNDFVESFSTNLRSQDCLFMLEVFYAGGTAQRDFSAADLARDIAAKGAYARFAPSRGWLAQEIARSAKPGDLVIVMGARDPSLTDLTKAILAGLATSHTENRC